MITAINKDCSMDVSNSRIASTIGIALVAFTYPLSAFAQIQVTANVTGFTSQSGNAIFVLYDGKKGFASDLDTAVSLQTLPIQGAGVSATFDGLKDSDYALFVFHDEDNNGEFKTNWIGFPKEGAGNSNNHQGMPSFAKSSFNPAVVDTLDIEMWYP
jgi:uncharacterized protein (DUF2141 family)